MNETPRITEHFPQLSVSFAVMGPLIAVRYALRSLRKSPASAITIIATLALCMGANTAVFSVVDAMLFRPLPYPEPNRLARVVYMIRAHGAEGMNSSVTGRDWEMIRD